MYLIEYINSLSGTQIAAGSSFLFLGFFTIYLNIRKIRKVKASQSWPVTSGVILHSYLSKSDGMNVHSGSNLNTATYTSFDTTDLRYYYIIRGRKYEGTKVTYTNHSPKDLVAKFHKGDTVKVYYDPKNYKNSVLIAGCPDGLCDTYFTALIISIPFFLVAAGVLIFG